MERFKKERVYLTFGTKLHKVFGNKSIQIGKLGLGKEERLFFLWGSWALLTKSKKLRDPQGLGKKVLGDLRHTDI